MNAPIRNFEVSCLLTLTLLVLLPCKLAHGQTYQVLYSFHGGNDGATSYAGVMRDRAGNLYGATEAGGETKQKNGAVSNTARRIIQLGAQRT